MSILHNLASKLGDMKEEKLKRILRLALTGLLNDRLVTVPPKYRLGPTIFFYYRLTDSRLTDPRLTDPERAARDLILEEGRRLAASRDTKQLEVPDCLLADESQVYAEFSGHWRRTSGRRDGGGEWSWSPVAGALDHASLLIFNGFLKARWADYDCDSRQLYFAQVFDQLWDFLKERNVVSDALRGANDPFEHGAVPTT